MTKNGPLSKFLQPVLSVLMFSRELRHVFELVKLKRKMMIVVLAQTEKNGDLFYVFLCVFFLTLVMSNGYLNLNTQS